MFNRLLAALMLATSCAACGGADEAFEDQQIADLGEQGESDVGPDGEGSDDAGGDDNGSGDPGGSPDDGVGDPDGGDGASGDDGVDQDLPPATLACLVDPQGADADDSALDTDLELRIRRVHVQCGDGFEAIDDFLTEAMPEQQERVAALGELLRGGVDLTGLNGACALAQLDAGGADNCFAVLDQQCERDLLGYLPQLTLEVGDDGIFGTMSTTVISREGFLACTVVHEVSAERL